MAPLISRRPVFVAMVEPADLRDRHDSPHLRQRHWSRFRRILAHTVECGQFRPLRRALEDAELVPQGEDLQLKGRMATEGG